MDNQVRIDIYSMVALIDPAVPLLAPLLAYRRKRFEPGGKTGYRGREEELLLWQFDVHDRMAVPVGLLPRVMRILAEQAYEVTLTDHRNFKEPFQFDAKLARSLGTEDRRLVKSIRRDAVGQIEVKNFADMIEKMRLIVSLYPRAHVLIPVGTRKTAWKVRERLFSEEAGWGVHLFAGTWPLKPPRCMVCTFGAMYRCHTEDWQIILLPDPLGAASDRHSEAMATLHGNFNKKIHRVYGFVQPGLRLGRRDRIHLEMLSGEVIYRIGPAPASVRVLWLRTPDCSAIGKDATALEFKRKAYWHSDRRNDYVAAVARAFQGQDATKLRKYGVPFCGGEPALRNTPKSRILVLVASTEQGRELLKRLPGWKLFDAVPGSGNKGAKVARGEGSAGYIVTEARAAKGEMHADIIIRAGGSAGTGCFKAFAPQIGAKEKKRDVFVVDFDDQFDGRAVRDTARRCREYELLGWDDDKGARGVARARKS